ncbi:MAG: 4'-phosphopantetheinyl transferase family protein [Solirubrobacteraceae bacterium]
MASVMLEAILPAGVAVVDTREDIDVELFPEERLALGASVAKRRAEFTTARACARRALARLGLPDAPIINGERGEPRWPDGIVGSITHCDGYRACALARIELVLSIGIDAERNAPLPDGLIADIARVEELAHLRELACEMPEVHWDRLLFSAKEAVYKAWFPLAQRWLGFEDATVRFDVASGTFTASLLVGGPPRLTGFDGRWMLEDGILATAIALETAPAAPCIELETALAAPCIELETALAAPCIELETALAVPGILRRR